MTFTTLNLSKEILKALEEQNYSEPSPIQQLAMPKVLEGLDIIGCAQTGSGKTCAFAVPMIQNIISKPSNNTIKGLVLAPTRELAMQIYESTKSYAKYTNVRTGVIFGGVKEKHQKDMISKNVDILVATPGRLLDFLSRKIVDIGKIDFFVLDEADRMLDMGFINDVKKIIRFLPDKRQTLLFSATMPKSIMELCTQLLKNPITLRVAPPSTTVETVEQKLYYVDKANKTELLIKLLKGNTIYSALVFCKTKHGADKINRALTAARITTQAIHGNKSQNARQTALQQFKSGKIQALVATDIAARGIDINDLSHVINYDLPDTTETYVHRIGRTARAGREGIAITFCCIDEMDMVKDIERDCNVIIEIVVDKEYEMTNFVKSPPKQQGRTRTQKPSFKSDESSNRTHKKYTTKNEDSHKRFKETPENKSRKYDKKEESPKSNFEGKSESSKEKYDSKNEGSKLKFGSKEGNFKQKYGSKNENFKREGQYSKPNKRFDRGR